jgi:hypothetical protein
MCHDIRKGHPRCSIWDGAETSVASMMTLFIYVHVCVFDRENSSVLGLNVLCIKMPGMYSIVCSGLHWAVWPFY